MFPQPVFQYGVSEPGKSSTCEMVYDFILLSDGAGLLDPTIATCLYTGAMTDTGSFRFSAATASVHRMVAHLMEAGLHHTRVHDEVYDAWSESRMRFLGYVLIEKMQLFPEYSAGLITLSKKDMQLFKVSTGDTEGVVNYPLSVRGIRFATLITERTDEVRLSFRSKGDFDVNAFARTHFSGGGHFNASGGRSSESFSETVARFTALLPEIHPS
jgi:phosphoesterase RecJ-like protein